MHRGNGANEYEQPGIYQMGHGHLMDAPQALVKGMGNNIGNEQVINCDKAINRVVYYFMKGHAAAIYFVKCN